MNKLLLLQAVFVFEGLLLAGLSLPMMLRRIGPNNYYGFRTPRTLANRQVWYDANAYCGALLFVSALCTLTAAVGFALMPAMDADSYGLSVGAVFGLTIVSAIVLSFVHLRSLKD